MREVQVSLFKDDKYVSDRNDADVSFSAQQQAAAEVHDLVGTRRR